MVLRLVLAVALAVVARPVAMMSLVVARLRPPTPRSGLATCLRVRPCGVFRLGDMKGRRRGCRSVVLRRPVVLFALLPSRLP